MRRRNPLPTAIGTGLILFFIGGPLALTFIGSIIPDRVLFDSSKGLFDEGVSLENYRYIFSGELPSAYRAQGANRTMISDAARHITGEMLIVDAGLHLGYSSLIAR
jgi:hypothetical protein